MSQAPKVDLNALWRHVVDQAKARTTLPALWRALEAAKPITVDLTTNEFVLGLGSGDMHQAGFITEGRTKNQLEQILESATHRKLTILVIPGESEADYEAHKAAQLEGQRLQQQTRQQIQATVEAGGTWEAVAEQLVRRWAALPNKALPSVQGPFLEEAIGILVEARGRLMPEKPSELDERGYSRALDRISERIAVPPAMIAYLVHKEGGR